MPTIGEYFAEHIDKNESPLENIRVVLAYGVETDAPWTERWPYWGDLYLECLEVINAQGEFPFRGAPSCQQILDKGRARFLKKNGAERTTGLNGRWTNPTDPGKRVPEVVVYVLNKLKALPAESD